LRFPTTVMLLLFALSAGAQQAPDAPATDPELKLLPLTAHLDVFAATVPADKAAGTAFVDLANKSGLRVRADGMINVEIVAPIGSPPVDPDLITRNGGEVDAVWRHQTSAWLPPRGVRPLARALPPGHLLRDAGQPHDNDEGPGVAGSDLYRDGGADGTGITIGIIDRNFARLDSAQTQSPASVPPVLFNHDYTGQGMYSGTVIHGTGQVECVYDHAPGATYHVFRIANSTHLGLAVDDAITEGVDLLSTTQSWYNEGWADGSGTANLAVDTAGNAGILYFNSAGNRAQTHWQGNFASGDGDKWHEWIANGDETNTYTLRSGDTTFIYLSWNTAGGTSDYDLYLLDNQLNVLASSTAGGNTFEKIVWQNSTQNTVTLHVTVARESGAGAEFEIFKHDSSAFQHAVAASSITPPTNNLHPNTISIGAVRQNVYDAAQPDPIAEYSSRGPSNGGLRALDLAAPTSTTTWAYDGPFTGTSAATPNAAGIAAALWSSQPQLSAEAMRELLFHLATLQLDWGVPGTDVVYGYGGMFLPTFAPGTAWVDRTAGNTTADPAKPWYRVTDALAAVPNGGRILMLGGSYPAPLVLDKTVVLESVVEDAVVGAN